MPVAKLADGLSDVAGVEQNSVGGFQAGCGAEVVDGATEVFVEP